MCEVNRHPIPEKNWEELLAEIREDQEKRREEERKAPRLNFLRAAAEAGFTESQAEFLWSIQPKGPLREWRA